MYQRTFFVILSLSFFSTWGQIGLELKNVPISLEKKGFYIDKVIDSRKDTSKIGWSLIQQETRGKYYTFKGGLPSALYTYFKKNLQRDSTSVPITVNVTTLLVVEKKKAMRSGKAIVGLQFLLEKEGHYGVLYQTSSNTESMSEMGKDIYTTHERRIRIVLNQCLKNFSETNWSQKKPDFVSLQEIRMDAQNLDTLSDILKDTSWTGAAAKKEEETPVHLNSITFKAGILPTFISGTNKYHSLWPFKKDFAQLNDTRANRLFVDYKGKLRLSLLTFGIGAVLVGASFMDDSYEETGLPNLVLLVPGSALVACSIPIYVRSNKLARKAVERYNLALENK